MKQEALILMQSNRKGYYYLLLNKNRDISDAIYVQNGRLEDAIKKLNKTYAKELKTQVKNGFFHLSRGQKHRRQMMRSRARWRERMRLENEKERGILG